MEAAPAPRELGAAFAPRASVDLYWIPLGAGGASLVRASGRVYELIRSVLERRPPLDLYHSALEVRVGEVRFVIENAWPSPDAETVSRGVVIEGPVWSPILRRFRVFRYEVRCWQDGTIPDIDEAVSRHSLSNDHRLAQHLLDVTSSVPPLTWGRRVNGSEEMWNSNSVISYLLTLCGISAEECRPPAEGRAPGWRTGIMVSEAIREGPSSFQTGPGP